MEIVCGYRNRRFLLVVMVLLQASGVYSKVALGEETRAQRLGPIPKDQQNNAQERDLVLPSLQRDAYQFAREGERVVQLNPRIMGGVAAPVGAYPWQVSIALANVPTSLGHFCGGAVVNENWVLTAAHCVDGTTKPESIKVVYGTNYLSQGGEVSGVDAIIVHDNWDARSFDYDIALLKTTKPLQTASVKLVTVENAVDLVPPGVLGTVSGWGLTSEGGTISDVLQHVGVQVTSNEICNSPASYFGQITDRMVCAGFATGGRDSCQGDSGGPFVVFDRKGGYALAGIVSWGEGCAQPNKYGVYTRVSVFEDWVRSKIGE